MMHGTINIKLESEVNYHQDARSTTH